MTKNQQILAKIGGGSLALLLSLGLGQQAYAVTLVENLSQSNSDTGGITFDDLWQGSSFTTGSSSYNLNSATLLFQEFSASTDLFVRLYSDNSGQPGTVITNFTNPTPITTTLTNNTFTLATPQALAANTTYWLVSGTTGGGEYYWGYTQSFNQTGLPGWTIGDGFVFSSDQSASWGTDPTGGPYQFSLEGTATSVPEPGSVVALLGLGGLGLASSLKKRK
ncbi:PEP-CTERM putative exosortase interaction domain protein [Microcystis aeruginosa TAIHU98]|uniref:PEP-CTERM sorting domain-containing protein n=2 Tax=Microcystis TaxID=1125 RepID=A0ABR8GGN1_MICVR|nr:MULTISPECIES: choice-of-anchor R domain-containing protein [Microcystis]ELP53118.1 PEP-CTERM putative exosortase interaction domain protein [Microcystis aeruginosa TAIHU98]MBD2602378.1 PEP-CTERM sorting domain-containing protein [Microcystis viridis FACHB-1342]MCA2625307.1 PEP-CTERM sorting domain-containing protein [Microcystis sp. M19BS1]MCA2635065.1 PEP-CTERM sorting domain-containing protein [Microcystis sp. M20BS1]ROI11084.1 PEP-CTERM sorting domain-containing protein [Microcystis aeru